MWLTSIAMCYLDCFIDNLNYTFQDFLIIFFELLARITLVIGAISIFPQEPYSNKKSVVLLHHHGWEFDYY